MTDKKSKKIPTPYGINPDPMDNEENFRADTNLQAELLQERNKDNFEEQPIVDPTQNYPDAKMHQIISFVKSGVRILGYVFLPINILHPPEVIALPA